MRAAANVKISIFVCVELIYRIMRCAHRMRVKISMVRILIPSASTKNAWIFFILKKKVETEWVLKSRSQVTATTYVRIGEENPHFRGFGHSFGHG